MLAVISLLGVLPMAIAGKIHPHVGMHVASRPKPVANKAASVTLAKPHKISRPDRAAAGSKSPKKNSPLFSNWREHHHFASYPGVNDARGSTLS
jgi:hypothetical protein